MTHSSFPFFLFLLPLQPLEWNTILEVPIPPFFLPPPASSFAASETQEPAFRSCELVGGGGCVLRDILPRRHTGQVAFCATRNASREGKKSFVFLTFAWESVQLFFLQKEQNRPCVRARHKKNHLQSSPFSFSRVAVSLG